MDSEQVELLVDLHRNTDRQGPGGKKQTRLAVELSGLKPSSPTGTHLRIADVGSGTGAVSTVLAEELGAHVTAVDSAPSFLRSLASRRAASGRIETVEWDMTKGLPFEEGTLDAIWSEGAIYNVGFEKGIQEWRKYLKPKGILAVSELTWLTSTRPQPINEFWKRKYAEVDTESAKIALLERHNYKLLGYFVLPEHCWLENYYGQLDFEGFLKRHGHSEAAQALAKAQKQEIDIYQNYHEYFGYGYYVAKRVDDL